MLLVSSKEDVTSVLSQADTSTAGLVQSYGDTPGATPVRTPRLLVLGGCL